MIYMYIFMLFTCSVFLFFVMMLFLYLKFMIFFHWSFMFINSMSFEFIMVLDWVSLSFLSLVMMISSMVLLYSVSYMSGDKTLNRFFYLVLLFILSMLLMIISPNIMSILLGWDGLGLVSYALVIYYQSWKSFNSGMVTVLMNRVGDVGILMMISLLAIKGSWNLIFFFKESNIMAYLLILSACTKSAQMPFSVWLPLAMAAPTPVSSLVHSSTLVTAGVYLMIRFNVFMNEASSILLFISSLTMFMAGLAANFENDLKKIIALSTLSQLGLMMSILSLGEVEMGFFHLIIHALIKSLLFMCSGSVIHLMLNNQDIRCMGSLIKFYPFLSVIFWISLLSLGGFPFLSGFYSKDLIMEWFLMSKMNFFSLILLFLATIFTVSYSSRVLSKVYLDSFSGLNCVMLKNEDWLMSVAMSVMLIFTIFGGHIFVNLFFYVEKIIILKFMEKNLVLLVCGLGLCLGQWISKKDYSKINVFWKIFLSKMFGIELVFTFSYELIYKITFFYYSKMDKGFTEFTQVEKFKLFLNLIVKQLVTKSVTLSSVMIFFVLIILISFISLI